MSELEILPPNPPKPSTEEMLGHAALAIAEAVTGILSSAPTDHFLSIGHVLQRVRGGKLLQTLKEEWSNYREKGKVKDDYSDTEQHFECLQEMLDFLDKDQPDKIKFNVLKKILLIAATESISSRDDVLPQQYMRLCRGMSSGEIMVLLTTYTIYRSGEIKDANKQYGAERWLNVIAQKSDLKYGELVEIHERGLIEKNLISPRIKNDPTGVRADVNFRLTNLGIGICKFIEMYDSEAENQTDTTQS